MHTTDFEKLGEGPALFSHYDASILSDTSKEIEKLTQTKGALCLVCLFMTICVVSWSIGLNIFKRHWKQFITDIHSVFCGIHKSFVHIVSEPVVEDTRTTTAILYLTKNENSALSKTAKKLLLVENQPLA